MTDVARIIEFMQEHKSITCKECQKHIGTTELRRRIRDIKDMGYEIGDVWEDGENRVGVKTRYKRYFIIKEPNCAVRPKKEEIKRQISFKEYFKKLTFWKK